MKASVVFICRYLPPAFQAGGPVSVVRTLLADPDLAERIDFLGGSRELGGDPMPSDVLKDYDRAFANIIRRDGIVAIARFLLKQRWRYRVINVNSVFDPTYSILPLLLALLTGAAICISPRGELHPPALSIKTPKKRVWMALLRLIGRLRHLHWLVTNDEEAGYVRSARLDRNATIHVLNDPIPLLPDLPRLTPASDAPPVVLTCGRIAPIKNHRMVMDCLLALQCPVHWKIIGPVEDPAILADLQAAATASPWITLDHAGACPHLEVLDAMRQADLLFNPSLSENFGYVFMEAFACGLPVLTSTSTPWKDLAAAGVGEACGAADKDGFVHALTRLLKMRHDPERPARCRRYYEAIARDYSPSHLADVLENIRS